jgi:hypothetical protein
VARGRPSRENVYARMEPAARDLQRLGGLPSVVPNIAGPARLVPLRSLANQDVSYEALRKAALRGRLQAEFNSDGTWRSSGHAVKAYLANRHKRSLS